MRYNQAIAVLGRYSLVTATPHTLGLHRLVQAVIRARLEQEEGRWAQVAVQLRNAAFPTTSWELASWPACKRLLPHVLATTEHAQRLGVAPEHVGGLLTRASWYLRARGQPGEAKPLAERALSIAQETLAADNPQVGDRCDELGRALRDLGDYRGAKQQLERALAIHQAAYGPDSSQVGARHHELGIALWNLGDLAGARTEYERALEIGQATLGPDHPYMATMRNNLGNVLRGLGNLAGARAQYEQVLAINEAALGAEHPTVADDRRRLDHIL